MQRLVAQKLFLFSAMIGLSVFTACGKNSSPTQTPGSKELESLGPKICYMGEHDTNSACARLVSIDPHSQGYLNPYSDPTFMSHADKDQYRMPIQAVDLKVASPSLKLARSFSLSEFMSIRKGDFGIFSTSVVKKLQEIRDVTGAALRVNSAYRSPLWNSGIDGSAKWSRHQYGDAVDIASTKATLNELVTLCRDLGATYVDKYVSHVHCDWRRITVDPSFFGELEAKATPRSTQEVQSGITKDLNETSQIHISGQLKSGNIILLSSTVTYKEDTEQLYKRWIITSPTGSQIDVEQAEVSLPVITGTYQITHFIGENIILNRTISIK